MACFATPYGLRYAAHCFNRAHAQQSGSALIPAGGKLGVTSADTKSDWYTQSEGAFQPRIELIEEYRKCSHGQTIHIIPLSRLLELFDAGPEAVADTRDAESVFSSKVATPVLPTSDEARETEWLALAEEQEGLQSRIRAAEDQLRQFAGDDYNTSLSLPWNRAAHAIRIDISQMQRQLKAIQERLLDMGLENWR